MNELDLARALAGPAQRLGLAFYFDAGTRALAHERGLNSVEFYGLGRAGVLGDVPTERVTEVFAFFAPRAIEAIWSVPRARCEPVATAREYVEAAYAFADRTFGALDVATLGFVGRGARRVAEGAAPGEAPLAEGYLALADPVDPVHQGYLGTILLRELRGGVYANAVRAEGLDGRRVGYLDSPADFAMHGFTEDEVPEITDELRAGRRRAEATTDQRLGELLKILDGSYDDFARAVEGMLAALAEPVAVER